MQQHKAPWGNCLLWFGEIWMKFNWIEILKEVKRLDRLASHTPTDSSNTQLLPTEDELNVCWTKMLIPPSSKWNQNQTVLNINESHFQKLDRIQPENSDKAAELKEASCQTINLQAYMEILEKKIQALFSVIHWQAKLNISEYMSMNVDHINSQSKPESCTARIPALFHDRIQTLRPLADVTLPSHHTWTRLKGKQEDLSARFTYNKPGFKTKGPIIKDPPIKHVTLLLYPWSVMGKHLHQDAHHHPHHHHHHHPHLTSASETSGYLHLLCTVYECTLAWTHFHH